MPSNVRFTPKSGHWNLVAKCPLCAKSRHGPAYSITALCQKRTLRLFLLNDRVRLGGEIRRHLDA